MTKRKTGGSRIRMRYNQFIKGAQSFASVYRRSRSGLLGLALLLFFVLTAIFAPFLAPYDP